MHIHCNKSAVSQTAATTETNVPQTDSSSGAVLHRPTRLLCTNDHNTMRVSSAMEELP